jgi:hypothetical protein
MVKSFNPLFSVEESQLGRKLKKCGYNESDFRTFEKERQAEIEAQFLREYGDTDERIDATIRYLDLGLKRETIGEGELTELRFDVDGMQTQGQLPYFFQEESEILAPRCTPAQDAHNRAQIRKIRTVLVPKLRQIETWGRTRNNSSTDTTEMVRLADEYNAINDLTYYRCLPSFNEFASAYNSEFLPAFNRAEAQKHRGVTVVWDNANRILGDLSSAETTVRDRRTEFETSSTGGQGVAGIRTAHDAFLQKERLASSFTLTRYDFGGGRVEDPARFAAEVRRLRSAEASVSAITELDRLRDEYVTGNRPVPQATDFTQSKSSAHFSFAEMNTGNYSWAVLTDALLNQLEAVRSGVGNLPVQILSGYRNPVRNDSLPNSVPTSRHQYGDAADANPSDYNNDGQIDSGDRDILAAQARGAGFNEVIPKRISVHMANE